MFQTFFMAGYESASPKLRSGYRVDLLGRSRHPQRCRSDYRLIKALGITTVREGLAWSRIARQEGHYDFTRYEQMMRIAEDEGIGQIWSLNHFDYPEYLDVFSPDFIESFTDYARACIELIRQYQSGTIYIAPINEISFWSHMGASIGVWAPFHLTKGYIFRKQLIKATISAMDAIRQEDNDVRFIQTEPLFDRKAKKPITMAKQAIEQLFTATKFQVFDMLSGKLEPKLGGHPRYLDIIGGNYYPYNQEWITGDDLLDETCHTTIPFQGKDWRPLGNYLNECYQRYKRPLVITETSAWGDLRPRWWRKILPELNEAMLSGIPIHGICIYPVIDRHNWTESGRLTHSGLWDYADDDRTYQRIPHKPTIAAIKPWIDTWRHLTPFPLNHDT